MPRRVQRTFQARGRRQPSTWSRIVPSTSTVVAAGTKALFSTLALSNPGIGETVRRTRGSIMVKSDQAGTDEEQIGALGFVVVSDLAIAAGAASIPGPVSEAQDDGWFVWQPLVNAFEAGEAGREIFHYDSKAMRRVEEGFTIAVMVENAHATTGMEVVHAFSLLSSLS